MLRGFAVELLGAFHDASGAFQDQMFSNQRAFDTSLWELFQLGQEF